MNPKNQGPQAAKQSPEFAAFMRKVLEPVTASCGGKGCYIEWLLLPQSKADNSTVLVAA